jgi:hypothetical protein
MSWHDAQRRNSNLPRRLPALAVCVPNKHRSKAARIKGIDEISLVPIML